MTTPTGLLRPTETPTETVRLLPDQITLDDAQLNHRAVTAAICPTTGMAHGNPTCDRPCHRTCNHQANNDLTADTHTFTDVEGNICPTCADDIADQLNPELAAINTIAEELGHITHPLNETAEFFDNSNLAGAEAGMVAALSTIKWAQRNCLTGTDFKPYRHYVTQQLNRFIQQLQQYRQQLSAHTSAQQLQHRLLTLAAAATATGGHRSTEQLDLLVADTTTVSTLVDNPDQPYSATEFVIELRKHWIRQATGRNYQPNQAISRVANHLHLAGADHTTAQQLAAELVGRWDTHRHTLWQRHTGRPRLVAVNQQVAVKALNGMTHSTAALRVFTALHLPVPHPDMVWQFIIIDETTVLGLVHIDRDNITDCGPADRLLTAANDADADIGDVLQLLEQNVNADSDYMQYGPDAIDMQRTATALIAALHS